MTMIPTQFPTEPDGHRPTGELTQEVLSGGTSKRPPKQAPVREAKTIVISDEVFTRLRDQFAVRMPNVSIDEAAVRMIESFVLHAPPEVCAMIRRASSRNIWTAYAEEVRVKALGEVAGDLALANALREFVEKIGPRK